MPTLTESIARLRAEILAWRHHRATLQQERSRHTRERQIRVSRFRASLTGDRAAAGRAWRALAAPTPTHKRKRKTGDRRNVPQL